MAKKKEPAKKKTDAVVVETVHVEGITYQRRLVACGKDRCRKGCASGRPSHGPYWYAVVWDPKREKSRTHYVGKQLPRLDTLADRPDLNERGRNKSRWCR